MEVGDLVYPYGNRGGARIVAISYALRVARVRFAEPSLAVLGSKVLVLFEAGEFLDMNTEHLHRQPRQDQKRIRRLRRYRIR